MVPQFTVNLYFHCCYLCYYMYIVDCNKDLIFFSEFLDLQSIRDDEATTQRSFFFFNALTDALITSRKIRVEVANSGKQ